MRPPPPRLHIEVHGSGPPIVLGHGFGGSARNFSPQARALRDRNRCILFDARGHARSEAPPEREAYVPERFVSDLHEIVEAAGGRAVIGGISMGAGIALRHALEHRGEVRGLVLAAFPPPGDRSPSSWALAFADAIESVGLDAAGERFVWGGSRFDATSASLIRRGFLEHRPHGLVHTLRQLIAAQPSVREMAASLAGLDAPALLIVGAEDPPSVAATRELERALPNARAIVVPGAGHVVNLQQPEAFNAALVDFLRRVEEPG